MIFQCVQNDNWVEAFYSELGPALRKLLTDDDDDSIEVCSEEVEVEYVHTTTVHSYFNAIQSLEDVYHFFE